MNITEKEATFTGNVVNARITILGIDFARTIEEEIEKIDWDKGEEERKMLQSYVEGLKRGLELFIKAKSE